MKEIEANKKAWGLIAQAQYERFKEQFKAGNYRFNPIISKELGDIAGKKVLHLQCNTGADSLVLAEMGAEVTGVDLVPDNISCARKLAGDLGVKNVDFLESDIMELRQNHTGKYDIVFTSDGAIGWLPDLAEWGRVVRHFLKEDGYFFVHDSHPFFLSMDEDKIQEGIIEIKYPYFGKEPDEDTHIGGYASQPAEAKNYFWMYTMSDLVNALAGAGLFIEYLQEYDRCAPGMGGLKEDEEELMSYPKFKGAVPLSFSLKAVPR